MTILKTTELCTLCELYGVRIIYQVVQIKLNFSPWEKKKENNGLQIEGEKLVGRLLYQ